MLPDENNAVVELLRKIVVGWSRPALKKFRGAMDLVYRKGAASVMTIPDHNLTCAGGPCALNRGIHFADENPARLDVPPLSGQQLLVRIVYTAGAFQIGHDQNTGALRKTDRAKQENAEYDPHHNHLYSTKST